MTEQATLNLFGQYNTTTKYENYIISAIVDFLKKEWNFEAKISVRKKQSKSLFGDIVLNNNSVVNNKFTLHFNPDQSYLSMIKTLIHELTHVKQVTKGELNPSSDWKSMIWKDDYVLSVSDYKKAMRNFAKYKELPWEAEAYSNMGDKELLNKFFKSKYWVGLKGKDATLDFIIDNI